MFRELRPDQSTALREETYQDVEATVVYCIYIYVSLLGVFTGIHKPVLKHQYPNTTYVHLYLYPCIGNNNDDDEEDALTVDV